MTKICLIWRDVNGHDTAACVTLDDATIRAYHLARCRATDDDTTCPASSWLPAHLCPCPADADAWTPTALPAHLLCD